VVPSDDFKLYTSVYQCRLKNEEEKNEVGSIVEEKIQNPNPESNHGCRMFMLEAILEQAKEMDYEIIRSYSSGKPSSTFLTT
jgi:hypothetical protein